METLNNMENICPIGPFSCFFSFLMGQAAVPAPRAAEQGAFPSNCAGGMERPVGWSVLKNKAFNQKHRSSAYLVVLSS